MNRDFRVKTSMAPPGLEGRAPARAGVRPQMAVALTALVLMACANTGDDQVTEPIVLGMTPSLGAAYDDGETQMYEVQTPVPLPIRRPLDLDVQGLPDQAPYPRMPYLKASDIRVEVRWTITNLDDVPHDVQLLLDPWNEFVRYVPGVVVSEEETQPNPSGWDVQYRIQPKERKIGVLTSDDMTELAVDLATAESVLANPPDNAAGIMNRAFDVHNRSNQPDPIVSPFIPKVIAGLTGFDLGLRMFEKGTVAVEITIDVTDLNGNRVLDPGAPESARIDMPDTIISPPGASMIN
jgi:hypothetical protein